MSNNSTTNNIKYSTTIAALALSGALLVGACGGDSDASAETPAETAAPESGPADSGAAEVVEISMADFSYGGLPPELPAGARIEVTNTSEAEIHEFVAIRLEDGDDRPVEEIVESDLERLLTEQPPAAVLLAAPGGEQINAVGDGTLTEPGRYVVVCVIPTGADPAEYLQAAAASDGPPQVDGGAPHVANGMFAEVTVIL